MDPATLIPKVLQAAHTSRLLGVDFVPAYRSGPGVHGGDFTPAPASPPSPTPIAGPTPMTFAPAPTGFVEMKPASRKPADVQAALDALQARYESDAPHKNFVTAHTKIVFGEGDPCARLMFVGEAPGAEEDRLGRPFVGRSGQLLDKMIAAMGLKRDEVYIGNVLKTRPPDNATPTSDEIRICAPYLYQQIAIVQPEAIVCLGLPATRALLQTMDSMSRLRGRWATFHAPAPADREIPVMPTYHPAFLLRSYTEENRTKVWSDLRMVMERLGLANRAKIG